MSEQISNEPTMPLADIGTRGKKEVGTADESKATAMRVSTGRRFCMIGHTVKIVNPREGWEIMKGSYATVLIQWDHDGSVLVEMNRPGRDKKEKSCFAREEVEMVPMNDAMRHADTEEYRLIIRSVALSQMTRWGGPDKQPLSDALKAAVLKRAERLATQTRAIQRIQNHDLPQQAKWMAHGVGNWCTALVLYTGGAD